MKKQIPVSQLRSVLRVQQLTKTANATEGFDEKWITILYPVRGQIVTNTGRPYTTGEQGQSTTTHTITIRSRPGIQQKMRIESDGIYYTIRDVVHDQYHRHSYLILLVDQEQVLI